MSRGFRCRFPSVGNASDDQWFLLVLSSASVTKIMRILQEFGISVILVGPACCPRAGDDQGQRGDGEEHRRGGTHGSSHIWGRDSPRARRARATARASSVSLRGRPPMRPWALAAPAPQAALRIAHTAQRCGPWWPERRHPPDSRRDRATHCRCRRRHKGTSLEQERRQQPSGRCPGRGRVC
jgi:hypothetical protein